MKRGVLDKGESDGKGTRFLGMESKHARLALVYPHVPLHEVRLLAISIMFHQLLH